MEQQFDSLESQTRYIGQKIKLNDEKRARREIGRLTKPKRLLVQPPIIYPERPKIRMTSKYQHDSIDYSSLDNVGVAYKIHQQNDKSHTMDNRSMPPIKSATLRPSKSSNLSSIIAPQPPSSSSQSAGKSFGPNEAMYARASNNVLTSSAIRPSTPPISGTSGIFNSLARHSKDSYRSSTGYHHHHHPTPLVIPPPQVPSNYASSKDLQPQQSQKSSIEPEISTSINNDKQTASSIKSTVQSSSQQTEQTKIDSSISEKDQVVDSSSPNQDWIPSNFIEKGKKTINQYEFEQVGQQQQKKF